MFSIHKILPLFALSIFLLSACKNDAPQQPQIDKNFLTGRWELKKAWRNGKETETLTNTFYEFSPEGMLRTNLTKSGQEEECPFSVNGSQIRQKCVEQEIVYSVETLMDSSLVFSTEISDIPFKLSLKKVPPQKTETVEEIILQ